MSYCPMIRATHFPTWLCQDVYLDEKGKLVENFRVAAFGHINGDQTPLHYAVPALSMTLWLACHPSCTPIYTRWHCGCPEACPCPFLRPWFVVGECGRGGSS